MVTIDLITGFLGSGKTTFLKLYAKWLIKKGNNICILENDYGPVNVDMIALEELRGDHCEIEMISGGSDLETHRRRFKTKLIQMAMSGYDYVLVEPSGIYDTDEFFDALHDDPVDKWYKAGNAITIIDAGLSDNLSKEERYILTSETANCGMVIISKAQLYDRDAPTKALAIINNCMSEFSCNRRINSSEVMANDWSMLKDDDFKRINSCGYKYADHVKLQVMEQNNFDSMFFMNEGLLISRENIIEKAGKLLNDGIYGHIIRIKGQVQSPRGSWTDINITRSEQSVNEQKTGQDILIVIGEKLDKEKIRKIMES
ncbi:MAG: GTP-binding protein [Catonella sp.]|nr:GTP-binding protein [Catonella sp.]MDY6355686.1 GTP-binding protein [Catonella sp.]